MPSPAPSANATVLARQALVFLLLAWILRLLLNWTLARLHLPHASAFFDSGDIFADSIKSALAERAVSAPLLTDPRVHHWPALFRGYLFHNTYLAPGMSIYWEPPLGALQLMGVARLMVVGSPWAALATEIAVYGVGVASFAWLLLRLEVLSTRTALLLAAPLCLSYPALYMLDRANFHSGLASLCLATYFCTAFTGRWRWLGVAALCYSINVRPNTAVVAMVELVLAPSLISAVRLPLLIAAISGVVFGCSLLAVHHLDPDFTFSSFQRGYALYQQRYIIDGMGLSWNDSFYGAVMTLRCIFGLAPAYSAVASGAVTAVAAVTLLGFAWLAVSGRLHPGEAFFIAAAFCVLFTPVYGQYHILIFAGVLAVLGLETAQGGRRLCLQWAWPGLLLFAALGWAVEVAPAPGPVLLLLLSVVLAVARLQADEEGDMIAVISLLVLSPLGGQYTNGLPIAALLAASLVALYARAARRPIGTAAPLIAWARA
jgi:hypothetical protein